jgi:hypothetical protein
MKMRLSVFARWTVAVSLLASPVYADGRKCRCTALVDIQNSRAQLVKSSQAIVEGVVESSCDEVPSGAVDPYPSSSEAPSQFLRLRIVKRFGGVARRTTHVGIVQGDPRFVIPSYNDPALDIGDKVVVFLATDERYVKGVASRVKLTSKLGFYTVLWGNLGVLDRQRTLFSQRIDQSAGQVTFTESDLIRRSRRLTASSGTVVPEATEGCSL